ATSSGIPVTSASTPAADRCTMPAHRAREPRSAVTAGWATSPSSAFSDQLQRQLPVRLDGPRVGRGAFVCPRTCADQRRGEAGIYYDRCLRRVRTRCVGVHGNRSLRVAECMNWVTGACGVILERIEFHARIEPPGPIRTNVRKADGA